MTFWQGDKRWSRQLVGNSTTETIGGVGCLVTCMAEARRLLLGDKDSTPRTVNEEAKRWPFPVFAAGSAAAVVDALAESAGLRAGPRIVGDPCRSVITVALAASPRQAVLLHVSHNGGNVGQHWLFGTSLTGDILMYLDPATGRDGALSMRTLQGKSPFSAPYKVCRAAALSVR